MAGWSLVEILVSFSFRKRDELIVKKYWQYELFQLENPFVEIIHKSQVICSTDMGHEEVLCDKGRVYVAAFYFLVRVVAAKSFQ